MNHATDLPPHAHRHALFRARRTRRILVSASLALLFGGCLTYSPQELSALPSDRLCEMQLYSRVNLSEPTKALLQTELTKRNEDCRMYVAQLERERAEDRERRMYELNGP